MNFFYFGKKMLNNSKQIQRALHNVIKKLMIFLTILNTILLYSWLFLKLEAQHQDHPTQLHYMFSTQCNKKINYDIVINDNYEVN